MHYTPSTTVLDTKVKLMQKSEGVSLQLVRSDRQPCSNDILRSLEYQSMH